MKKTINKEIDIEKKKKKLSEEKATTSVRAGKEIEEWREVEILIRLYKNQFSKRDDFTREQANIAMEALLDRFYPLFRKYLVLVKSGQINFNDAEMKKFVLNFIGDPELKKGLRRAKQSASLRNSIYQRFNFIKETYGALSENEIMEDLKILFMTLAKRYKPMNKSFCGYLYNAYCFEVARHIKKFTENPANIHYRNSEYEDYIQRTSVDEIMSNDLPLEDRLFEDASGIPDSSWISGETCSEAFQELSPYERKLLIKYYLEDYNDRQIAEKFGMHVNTVNQKRRIAAENLAAAMGLDKSLIKRNRKSGKNAFNLKQ